MTRTSKICAALFPVVLFGALLYAETPAMPDVPADVRDNYVMTPNGYFHPSCVREVKKGETLMADRHAIQHVDGSIEILPVCPYPHYDARGEIVTNGALPPTISHAWIEYASTTTSTAFGELSANWVVPPAPTSHDGQLIYLFTGMEDYSDTYTILQPVLQWGNNGYFGGNFWEIASWNCCPSGYTFFSGNLGVNPGDEIQGIIEEKCSRLGDCGTGIYYVETIDVNLNQGPTLQGVALGQTFNWAFAGALEVYRIAQCSDYPPNGGTNFFNEALYETYVLDTKKIQIANPGWSYFNVSSGLTPQCNYGGKVDSATEVSLDY
jgi:hypothetical protein